MPRCEPASRGTAEAANKQFTVRHDATKRDGNAEGGSAWHGNFAVLDYLTEHMQETTRKPFLIYGFSHPHDTRDGTPELLAKYGATDPHRPAVAPGTARQATACR